MLGSNKKKLSIDRCVDKAPDNEPTFLLPRNFNFGIEFKFRVESPSTIASTRASTK